MLRDLTGPPDPTVCRVLLDLLDPRVPQGSRVLQDYLVLTVRQDQ